MNPYTYLFYIIYKFIKFTTKEELQDHIPKSATALYLICLTNNYAVIIIGTKIINYFPSNLILTILAFAIVPAILYFVNKSLFIDNQNYLEVESKYDKKNSLTKTHFIVITILYIIASIGFMIWSGVNYKK